MDKLRDTFKINGHFLRRYQPSEECPFEFKCLFCESFFTEDFVDDVGEERMPECEVDFK